MKMHPITSADVAVLREYVALDVEAGILRWIKKPAKKVVVGTEAGRIGQDGYKMFVLNHRRYRAHRVVYALLHGSCEQEIDHINRNPSDNRPENLRGVTRSQQNMNRRRPPNKTGFSGVYRHPGTTAGHVKVFCARIKLAGKYKTIGYFETPEEAHRAYMSAVETYHGEYAVRSA